MKIVGDAILGIGGTQEVWRLRESTIPIPLGYDRFSKASRHACPVTQPLCYCPMIDQLETKFFLGVLSLWLSESHQSHQLSLYSFVQI